MKKIYTLAAIAAIALASCQKESTDSKINSDTFSKAEIRCEVTNADGTGAASDTFWEYISIPMTVVTFEGDTLSASLTKSAPVYVITCTTKPTADKDEIASLLITPKFVEAGKSGVIDFNVKVTTVVYDAKGNEINTKNVANTSGNSKGVSLTAQQISTLMSSSCKTTLLCTKFSLGYFEREGKWTYDFGWEPADYTLLFKKQKPTF